MKYVITFALFTIFIFSCKEKKSESIEELEYFTGEYFDFSPTWSADGRQLIFASSRDHHPTLNLYIMNKDGSEQQRLTFEQEGYGSGFPQCSPVEDKIAFLSDRDDGFRALYIMDSDGSNINRLSSISDTLHSNIDFSPDGKFVYAEVSNEEGSNIYAFDIQTREKHQITDFDWGVGNPSVSPSGNYLAVTTGRWGNPEIEIFNMQTQEITRLTKSWADEGTPRWSIDGNHIYFYSNIDDPLYEIYRVNLETKTWERITDSPNWDLDARVSPQGNLAFHSTQNGRNSITITDSLGNYRIGLTNKNTTPFIEIIEQENLETAISHYPKKILDSLNTTYVLHEEMLGLADRLIKQNEREKAISVLNYIVKNIRSVWPDMTASYYGRLGVKAPMPQGVFFRYIQEKGIAEGKKKFDEMTRDFPDRRLYNWYEMILLAYWYHYHQDYNTSIGLLKMILQLYPNSFQTLHDLGQSFEARGDTEEALGYYQRAVEHDSTNSWYAQNALKKIEILNSDKSNKTPAPM